MSRINYYRFRLQLQRRSLFFLSKLITLTNLDTDVNSNVRRNHRGCPSIACDCTPKYFHDIRVSSNDLPGVRVRGNFVRREATETCRSFRIFVAYRGSFEELSSRSLRFVSMSFNPDAWTPGFCGEVSIEDNTEDRNLAHGSSRQNILSVSRPSSNLSDSPLCFAKQCSNTSESFR